MSGIEIRGASVRYNGRRVVDQVNLAVASGEWVTVIGPNGAGKTSLLRAVAGTVPLDGGEVVVDGHPVGELSRKHLARLVAVVPQQPILPEGMTALDYVLLGRTPHLGYWAMESHADIAAADEALARLEATGLAGRVLGRLSGGERQRVVLARALVQESRILLLDEPTTALDIGHQQHVLDMVEDLRRERGMAVLSAVHDLTLAAQYADRLVLMVDGAVVATGSPEAVLTPDHLARFSGARVTVLRGPDGGLIVAPRRSQA